MIVLLTRPRAAAERSAARLAARGVTALISPVLDLCAETPPAPDGPFDAVLATKAHAFSSAAHRPWTGSPLFVVGTQTAAAARAAGFGAVAPAVPDAAGLIAALTDRAPSRFVYFAGADRKPTLERALTEAGHHVTVVVAYAARPAAHLTAAVADALRGGRVTAALHYSPRSAAQFVTLAHAAGLKAECGALRHLALSEDSAGPLSAQGWRVSVAERPDEDSLFTLL